MASGDGIIPEQATIYITATSVDPSSLASSDAVEAEVTNFSESGGEEDIESVPVFGGGNIDKVKPRTQLEVSFDVILRYQTADTDQLKWDSYKWGDIASSTVSSAGNAAAKRVYVQWSDGSLYYTRAYDNAKAVTFEPESSADDFLKGTITFKLSPTDADGGANMKIGSVAASTLTW
ncbi:hypothetical protein [uncultured Arcobacter sp.]|uniref:hypothetical protein n=1 Tax=uncultured Arcobacter sp. TaxID=165434 RepID=UPI002636D89B|nr:hypothetical protein [uncultured Arcobacter sp.]